MHAAKLAMHHTNAIRAGLTTPTRVGSKIPAQMFSGHGTKQLADNMQCLFGRN